MAKKKAKAAKRPKAKKTAKSAPGKAGGATNAAEKQQFLRRYAVEHETTLRVLRALPSGQGDFRPHPRSQSASELLHTMILEQEMKRRALEGGPIFGGSRPLPQKAPSFEAGIAALDAGYQRISEEIKKASDKQLAQILQFPVAKGQMGDWTALNFIWYMLLDHIHHRGQMSVYLRLAGGKVPSIYGPSGDDPWT